MKYEISVNGMKCQNCAKSIETGLNVIDGLLSCDVDIKKGIVIVDIKGGEADLGRIKSIISDLGFDVV